MRIRCVGRSAIITMLDSDRELLDRHYVISVLDTSLASPFMYSIYQKQNRMSDYRSGTHPNLLTLHFDDVTPDNIEEHAMIYGGRAHDYALFTEAQALRVLEWLALLPDWEKPFLLHCWAGISRSGALGTWIAGLIGLDHEEFLANNPQVKPNPHVLEVMHKVHALNPRFLEDFRAAARPRP